MTTTIRIPRAHKKRLKAFTSLNEVNRWGAEVDAAIVEILLSLGDSQRAIREITLSTGASSVGLHAPTHRPGGADPLATAAPISILGGTSSNSVGTGTSFSRNDHSHDVATAAPAFTLGTAAAEGSSNSLVRVDATLPIFDTTVPAALASAAATGSAAFAARRDHVHIFAPSLQSLANLARVTATDDAIDTTLTGSLGALNIRSATGLMSMDKWTGFAQQAAIAGRVLSFNARTNDLGTTLSHAIQAQVTFDATTTYTGQAHRNAELVLSQASTLVTYATETAQVLRLQYSTANFGVAVNTWTEIGGLSLVMGCPGGSGTTVTDLYGYRMTFPTLVTATPAITNGYGNRVMFPTLGGTIRRGMWVDPSSTVNIGAEAANTEGYYCGAIPRGTAQRTSYYALGATTGTPTTVVGFYAAAHGVGTNKWSFFGNDASFFTGTVMNDNSKHILGTGLDAEIYYDGTDLIIDPDVVGTGVLNILGGLRCDSIQNDTGLAAGVYTPTRSAEANMDANVTMSEAQYLRVGNTVTVSGRFTADPTLTATTTSFEMTLPIASNIGAAEDVAGTAFCGAIAAQGAEIIGVAANDTAKVQWKAGDITSQTWSFIFSYQVL